MGIYSDHILPRGINWAMSKPQFTKERIRVVAPLSGRVLEIGFGSGLNLPHYPTSVEYIYALDPAKLGRKLAHGRLEANPIPLEFVELSGDHYELDSNSVDAVLSTWTMCTIPDLAAALREIKRVLKPGGQLHFLEHGLSRASKVARWQKRLTPIQKICAGGCRLDVDHAAALTDAGFQISNLEQYVMQPHSAIIATTYLGVAHAD